MIVENKKGNKERDIWVDYVKVIACILVVLGHFYQSMVKSAVLPETDLYLCFIQTIYSFHVPLFFICSGFLYQKYSQTDSPALWINNVLKKLLALGIPYFTFTLITWLLKKVFADSVNNEIGSLSETLFLRPTAPYWYLYILFILFLITPVFKNKRIAVAVLILALVFKAIRLSGCHIPYYAVSTVMENEIWFVGGMCLCVLDLMKGKRSRKKVLTGAFAGVLFLIASIISYRKQMPFAVPGFVLGVVACASVILIVSGIFGNCYRNRVLGFLSRYTMPVFLMHTIFAAGIRSLLMKAGFYGTAVQIIFGLLATFGAPVLAFEIMKRVKYLEFFLYPTKFVQWKWNKKSK